MDDDLVLVQVERSWWDGVKARIRYANWKLVYYSVELVIGLALLAWGASIFIMAQYGG